MDNLTKEKIKEIITALETETVNIASNINLGKRPTANYSKTRDLINIGSVILWLKNCLRLDISNSAFEEKVKTFEEVIKAFVTPPNDGHVLAGKTPASVLGAKPGRTRPVHPTKPGIQHIAFRLQLPRVFNPHTPS